MNKGIGKFLTKKVLKLITLLVALCIITFVLMELSPIDPVTAYVGASTKVSAEQRQLIAEHWGLNQPPIIRFWSWFKSIISGDWGTSMIYRRPVLEVIGQKFMSSIWLMGISWILSGIIGFILGIIAGIKEGKLIDKIIRGYCYIIMSTPTFWLGILFIILFSVKLGWFPVALSVPIGVLSENVGFVERMQHIILPALTLSIISISSICMNTRQKVIEIMESDYILFAKAILQCDNI